VPEFNDEREGTMRVHSSLQAGIWLGYKSCPTNQIPDSPEHRCFFNPRPSISGATRGAARLRLTLAGALLLMMKLLPACPPRGRSRDGAHRVQNCLRRLSIYRDQTGGRDGETSCSPPPNLTPLCPAAGLELDADAKLCVSDASTGLAGTPTFVFPDTPVVSGWLMVHLAHFHLFRNPVATYPHNRTSKSHASQRQRPGRTGPLNLPSLPHPAEFTQGSISQTA